AAIDQVLRLTQPSELVIAGLVSLNAEQHLGARRTVIHGKNEEGIVGLRAPATRCRQSTHPCRDSDSAPHYARVVPLTRRGSARCASMLVVTIRVFSYRGRCCSRRD